MHALSLESGRSEANTRDIEDMIGKIAVNLRGTGTLSSRAKRSYYWFAELSARGFTSVRAPMAAHAHLQWLAFGQTKSVSTFRRSVAELERAGYVYRKKCRRGDVSTIEIDSSKFEFYAQQNKRFKEPECGTYAHDCVHRSNCPPDEFTNNYGFNKIPRSLDVTTSKKSKKHANKKKSFSDWIHPLVFSIGVVCYNLGRKERERLQKAALSAIADKIEPFDYWTAERWQAMAVPVREKRATELLPELAGIADRYDRARQEYARRAESPPPRRSESPPPRRAESPPPDREPPELGNDPKQLTPWFKEFSERMALKIDSGASSEEIPKGPPRAEPEQCSEPGSSLTEEEYRLMMQAKINSEVRRGQG